MRAIAFVPIVILGVLLAIMPSVAAPVPKDEPLPPVTEKDIAASAENMKDIVIAFANYASIYNGKLPNNIESNDGKPLLSWRVQLLSELEQMLPILPKESLYKEFKLDEAWDSEHNKKLIEKMPKVYAPIRVKAKAGETFYQVFTGKDVVFGPGNKPSYPASFPDGTSNTAFVFEAGEPVIWTKPSDLPFDKKKPLPKLGGMFDGEFHVGLADAKVKRIKKGADEEELKKLIIPNDGLPLDWSKLVK